MDEFEELSVEEITKLAEEEEAKARKAEAIERYKVALSKTLRKPEESDMPHDELGIDENGKYFLNPENPHRMMPSELFKSADGSPAYWVDRGVSGKFMN